MIDGCVVVVSAHEDDDVLAFLEDLLGDGLDAIPFRLASVEGVQGADDLVGVAALGLQISPERWGGDALVGGIEDPVQAERDVRAVQSFGAGDVEVALLFALFP